MTAKVFEKQAHLEFLESMIKELEEKKRAACDKLHGVAELDGLMSEVNKILKGADVPFLGA